MSPAPGWRVVLTFRTIPFENHLRNYVSVRDSSTMYGDWGGMGGVERDCWGLVRGGWLGGMFRLPACTALAMRLLLYIQYFTRRSRGCHTPPSGDPYPHPLAGHYDVHSPLTLPRSSQYRSGRPLVTCAGRPLLHPAGLRLDLMKSFNSFSQMGSHRSEPIGKLCRSAFSLILARSFWTGRDVSSA